MTILMDGRVRQKQQGQYPPAFVAFVILMIRPGPGEDTQPADC
jgi:hypothetical protein